MECAAKGSETTLPVEAASGIGAEPVAVGPILFPVSLKYIVELLY
jgi:hypothetical protein